MPHVQGPLFGTVVLAGRGGGAAFGKDAQARGSYSGWHAEQHP